MLVILRFWRINLWIAVRQRFRQFVSDLNPTTEQVDDAFGKARRIGQALQRAYGEEATETPPIFAVGSWGKGTQVRPSTDIDIMVRFDRSTLERFQAYAFNGQSAFLQEIKGKLETSYPQTRKRGDGQVVQIDFNSITVELVPVFPIGNGQFIMPDTNGGGSWKTVDPIAQIQLIDKTDRDYNGNVRPLCKIIKRWKHECSVDLKSFVIELLIVDFFRNYTFGKYDYYWYDFYVRDCLKFFKNRVNGWVSIPGTGEIIQLGDKWAAKVDAAIAIAETACNYERDDLYILAGMEWQKIFGPRIPIHVM
ncbi:nucleotidyltransferase [Acetobacter syzygii]|uniref:Nucleotidyltransferase n=1 Tax=Acetobacter syzygii TaxID=146476 RepID=A0A270BMW2_9PROT|nr:nucleotidyltransferase [Acetobacter syzygii]PAL26152.1 nucleotidyltransferase [Acetobacter syzygii]